MAGHTLTPVEFDLCWDHLDLGEPPPILAGPSHGVTLDERRALFRDAWRALDVKGAVAGPGELAPDLTRLLTVLARADQEVDARLRLDVSGPRTRAVAARRGRTAAFALVSVESVRVRAVDPDELVPTVVDLLPAHPTPRSRSVSLPADALDRAAEAAGSSAGRFQTLLRDSGLSWPDAHRVVAVLGAVRRMGQFGAARRERRDGGWGPRRRGGYVVAFYDTPDGRWQFTRRPSGDGRQWATLAPADRTRLTAAVTDLLTNT